MATIVTRSGKGYPLTWDEMDTNLTNLNHGSYISVKDSAFGAVGDGITDDAAAIKRAILYGIENGGTIYIPAGTYKMLTNVSTSSFVGIAKPFRVVGAGVGSTVIIREASTGTLFNIIRATADRATSGIPYVEFRDLTINHNGSIYSGINSKTIAIFEPLDFLVQNVVVNDAAETAIFIQNDVSYPLQGKTGLIDNVKVYGVPGTGPHFGIDVGILVAGIYTGKVGITNCTVIDGGQNINLSPGHGIEFKYAGPGCYVINCYVENCIVGFGFPSDGTNCNEQVRASNLRVKHCVIGLSGYLNNSQISNIIIDMDNFTSGLEPLQISGNTSSYTGLTILNQFNTPKVAARFITPASNNIVEIDLIYNTNNADTICSFESGCVSNRVILRSAKGITISSMLNTGLFSDLNTDKSLNNVEVDFLTQLRLLVIASGVITVNPKWTAIHIDTEDATTTDTLDTITGGTDGQQIVLRATATARNVLVSHGTGNIQLVGGADFNLTHPNDTLHLMYKANVSTWGEVSRSDVGV